MVFCGQVPHAGTELTEHLNIIITSAQKVDNLKQTLDRLLSTIRVRVIKTTGNIGIYRPRLFRVRSGPNQSYYTEYDWEHLSPYYTRKVKGRTLESE